MDELPELACLYQTVFESYLFPVHDPQFLYEAARKNTDFFVVLEDGKMVGASPVEKDPGSLSGEMTDFAVLPEQRGRSLGQDLLREMEWRLLKQGYHTAFSITRLGSPGMNLKHYPLSFI